MNQFKGKKNRIRIHLLFQLVFLLVLNVLIYKIYILNKQKLWCYRLFSQLLTSIAIFLFQ